ncbi:MAG: hypothetical protein ACR2MB_05920, partial [Acidimicrobiales bacterium]
MSRKACVPIAPRPLTRLRCSGSRRAVGALAFLAAVSPVAVGCSGGSDAAPTTSASAPRRTTTTSSGTTTAAPTTTAKPTTTGPPAT